MTYPYSQLMKWSLKIRVNAKIYLIQTGLWSITVISMVQNAFSINNLDRMFASSEYHFYPFKKEKNTLDNLAHLFMYESKWPNENPFFS